MLSLAQLSTSLLDVIISRSIFIGLEPFLGLIISKSKLMYGKPLCNPYFFRYPKTVFGWTVGPGPPEMISEGWSHGLGKPLIGEDERVLFPDRRPAGHLFV